MKTAHTCLTENSSLEAAAALAEQRKHQALDRLTEKLNAPPERDAFETAMRALIDADKAVQEAKGR